MSQNPINLAIRFILEVIALVSSGVWGWHQTNGPLRYVFAAGIPLLFATVWATFNVPDDGSRSGKALVKTPGIVRLFIEITFFSFATWCLYNLGHVRFSIIIGSILLLHYFVSYDRILWLFSTRNNKRSKR